MPAPRSSAPTAQIQKPLRRGDEADGERLGEHAADDEPLAADPIRQRAGDELAEAPHRWVEGGEHADASDGEASGGEVQREECPRRGRR